MTAFDKAWSLVKEQEPRGVPEKFSQLRRTSSESQDTGRMVDTPLEMPSLPRYESKNDVDYSALNIADLFSNAGGAADAFIHGSPPCDPISDQPITDQALGSKGLRERTRAAGVAPRDKPEKPDRNDRG